MLVAEPPSADMSYSIVKQPRFALAGYAWRSHAETESEKRVRRSLLDRRSSPSSEGGLAKPDEEIARRTSSFPQRIRARVLLCVSLE
jgi:hypothetical protein